MKKPIKISKTGSDREPATPAVAAEKKIIPVVAEKVKVDKRKVATGKVVVRKTVQKRREVVNPQLMEERVKIERVAVGRAIDRPAEIRREGNVLIVPVMEEVLVVEKRLMLKEELRITREQGQVQRPVEVTLEGEVVHVERMPLEQERKTA